MAIFLLLVLCLFSLTSIAYAAEDSPASAFVDRDGDGFNDNVTDSDNDGIPDFAEATHAAESMASEGAGAGFFSELAAETAFETHLSAIERFALREFTTRSLNSCRSDLARSFDGSGGPGTTLAGGGGNCVGGICF
ncbi:hypothetical protein GF420_14495 [candidate division GN15 bacterium]|nr:hypothetical protein [candidate division GN15 bacterium]